MTRIYELQRRVERLLAGERNTHDLYALFLWLRGRSFGNKAVADVGDFVAHSEERDKGMAWRGSQDFFNMVNVAVSLTPDQARPLTRNEISAAAWSSFDLYDPAKIRSETGLAKKKAKKVLADALSDLIKFDGRQIIFSRPISATEEKVFRLFSGNLVAKVAFDSEELVSQLMECILKNGLVDKLPAKVPKAFSAFVSLYALERMHLTRVALENGTIAMLKALPRTHTGNLEVYVLVPVVGSKSYIIGLPIYATNLPAEEWCEDGLIPEPFRPTDWEFPLEISPSGKLQML